MAGYRPPYTNDEEEKIVQYIVDHDHIERLKGDQLWKEIEEAHIVDRTWQSLKQHFRKQIIFDLYLPRYNLSEETLNRFYRTFYKVPKKKRRELPQNIQKALADDGPRKKARSFLLSSSSDDSDNT